MKFGYNWPVVSEKKSFETVASQPANGACLYNKLPGAFGSGELKKTISYPYSFGHSECNRVNYPKHIPLFGAL